MRRVARMVVRCTAVALSFLVVVAAVLFLPALYRRFVTYPSLELEAKRLASSAANDSRSGSLRDFRGVMHAHSYWSHDSRGTLAQILAAAHETGIDFVFLTDHPRADLDTFPRPFHGRFGDVLIVSGAEKHRLLVWPREPGVVNWRIPLPQLVDSLRNAGGLVFFAHTEKPHPWGLPGYHGMEIYNIHTDIKDEALWRLLPDLLVNRKYHRWIYRRIFDEQTAILRRWDELNRGRRIVGIAANDAHDNQHLRVRRTAAGDEWIGPNADRLSPGLWGWLLRPFFHAPDSAGFVFRWEIDPYVESFRFVNTHILADTLSFENLRHHLLAGHAFVAFESLAPARGFRFFAEIDNAPVAVLGDETAFAAGMRLRAEAPLAGRIQFIRNGAPFGVPVHGSAAKAEVTGPGQYRARVDLRIGGEWLPWIYANPIYIH